MTSVGGGSSWGGRTASAECGIGPGLMQSFLSGTSTRPLLSGLRWPQSLRCSAAPPSLPELPIPAVAAHGLGGALSGTTFGFHKRGRGRRSSAEALRDSPAHSCDMDSPCWVMSSPKSSCSSADAAFLPRRARATLLRVSSHCVYISGGVR